MEIIMKINVLLDVIDNKYKVFLDNRDSRALRYSCDDREEALDHAKRLGQRIRDAKQGYIYQEIV
jgi:hypothetical protein